MVIRKEFIDKMTQCQLYVAEFNIKWVDMTCLQDELELEDLIVKIQMLDLPWMEMIPNEPLPALQEPDHKLGSIINLPTPSQLMNALKSKPSSPKSPKGSIKGTKKGFKKVKQGGSDEVGETKKEEDLPTATLMEPPLVLPVIGEPKSADDEKLRLLMMLEPPSSLDGPPKGAPFNSTRSCMFAWGGALRLIHTLQRQPVLVRLGRAGKAKSIAEASIWLGADFFEAAAQAALHATAPAYAYQQGAYDLMECGLTHEVVGSIIMSVRLSCYGICAKSRLKSPGGDLMDRVPWLAEYTVPEEFDPTVCGWNPEEDCRDVCDLPPAIAAPLVPRLQGAKSVPPRPQVPTQPPTPEMCASRELCSNMIATRFQTKAMLSNLDDATEEKPAA